MKKDKLENIVNQLNPTELKDLATRKLKDLKKELFDQIISIAEISRGFKKNKEDYLILADKHYENIKSELQKYNLWENNYDLAYQKAMKRGEVDTNLFLYGTQTFHK